MKKTVAVFFGGVSPEHDISIITAISAIIKPLEAAGKYTVVPVYISKDGAWYSDPLLKKVATFQKGFDALRSKLKPLQLVLDGGLVLKQQGLRAKSVRIDIAFPAMHGAMGEDGSLMGLLRLASVPFVGCDMPAGVIAMDKVLAKQIAEKNDIPVAKYEYCYSDTFNENPVDVISGLMQSLAFPLFVKPAHLGSSIGITRATTRDELQNALEVAAYYDDKIIVEEAVPNLIEVTLPIMGNKHMQEALLERPLVAEEGVFDFDTKYLNGGKKGGGKKQTTSGSQGYSELPAKLPKDVYQEAIHIGKQVYKSAECRGTARIDMLIDSKKKIVYFNEINPLPGSLYAHNWRKAGVSGVQLVERLIELAIEDHAEQTKRTTTFSTNFLKQF